MRYNCVAIWLLISMASSVAAAAEALKATGMVLPYRQVELATSTDGVVTDILLKEGNSATQGQVLVQLDASRELMEAEYNKQLMEKRDADRAAAKLLFDENVLSHTQWEEHQVDAKLAETEYRIALRKLDDKSIKAPFAGLVLRVYKECGDSVRNLERIAELISIDKVYVVVYFDGADLLRVKQGQRAQVTFPLAERAVFSGVVETVDPVVDPASGTFRVKVIVDNPDHRIRSGIKADVMLMDEIANATQSK